MSKIDLQEQTDIIESVLLQAAGELRVAMTMQRTPSIETQDKLGEALSALLKVKGALGLHTNLSEEEL